MLQACTEKEFQETIIRETPLEFDYSNSINMRYNERNEVTNRLSRFFGI